MMTDDTMALPCGTGLSSLRDEAATASSPEASIPSATVSEHEGEAILFRVRAGWDWASIFVRPTSEGAEVAAHSSFGTYAYTWINMGGDWREFLSSGSRDYIMNKMAGNAYRVPLDRDEFIAAMRGALADHKKDILEAWGMLDSDQQRRLSLCSEALDDDWGWEDVPLEALFWHFNEQASGAPYALELYETRMDKINPQVVGFWETIWAPFSDYLASAIEARRAATGTGAVHESATGTAGDVQGVQP